ncbi:MAG: OmpA family protein [Deltaproteobacteria bacterium]|nr:OmpA family protein [Deltaproteobacteria bacterium]
MAAQQQPNKKGNIIVIKKIKKGGHAGHHGGAWKVAYADFVTAMMAFFLLLWLLSMVSDEKKARIAEYFREYTVFSIFEKGGSAFEPGSEKGIMDVKTEQVEKKGQQSKDQIQMDRNTLPGDQEPKYTEGKNTEVPVDEGMPPEGKKPDQTTPGEDQADEGAAGDKQMTKEQLKTELRKDIENRLNDMKDQVLVDTFEGGVRIQVTDKEGALMFALGGTAPTDNAMRVLRVIAERLSTLNNKIAVEGHTDALVYTNNNYSNWELSTARASAARLSLARFGLPADRLTRVAGYAATEPLIKENPNDPRNRRISILIYDRPRGPNSKLGAGTKMETAPRSGPKSGRPNNGVEEAFIEKAKRQATQTKP